MQAMLNAAVCANFLAAGGLYPGVTVVECPYPIPHTIC